MKKFFTKLLCIALSVTCIFTASACGGVGDNRADSSKTQLYLGIVANGYGTSWLTAAATNFEDVYAEESFEEGKKGVQVLIDSVEYGGTLQNQLANVTAEVVFTGDVNYMAYVTGGDMVDLTSIVKAPLTDFGETQSIEDKMTEEVREAYKIDNKYYALPYADANFGITYDKDMFDDNGWYFVAADPDKGDYTAAKDSLGYVFLGTGADAEGLVKSCGPDGKTGIIEGVDYTIDDGLPATYDQFFALCEMISSATVVPLIWSGKYQSYINQFLDALWINNSGKDEFGLLYTMDGTLNTYVTAIDEDGTVHTTSEPITEATGYKAFNQAGRYYALDFVDRIVKNEKYYDRDKCFGQSTSHTDAQNYFLYGSAESYQNYKKTAMLIEGSYWENEATGTFNSMATKDESYSKKNRNLAWMGLPRAMSDEEFKTHVEEGTLPNATVEVGTTTLMFINPRTTESYKMDLAKKFVQYMFTRENLAAFTVETSLYRPFDYTLTEAEKAQMSPYGRSAYEYFSRADKASAKKCNTVLNNYLTFTRNQDRWNSNNSTSYPSDAFRSSSVTAKTFFLGSMPKYQSAWSSYYKG